MEKISRSNFYVTIIKIHHTLFYLLPFYTTILIIKRPILFGTIVVFNVLIPMTQFYQVIIVTVISNNSSKTVLSVRVSYILKSRNRINRENLLRFFFLMAYVHAQTKYLFNHSQYFIDIYLILQVLWFSIQNNFYNLLFVSKT